MLGFFYLLWRLLRRLFFFLLLGLYNFLFVWRLFGFNYLLFIWKLNRLFRFFWFSKFLLDFNLSCCLDFNFRFRLRNRFLIVSFIGYLR